ncbi:MAG TPA: acetate--CoA ligase family protein [Dongiaceae bacterium]|jgi:acyl-CoA synthetase (NDP forming)|nr:acetate--CoA ligase family protein [Dongiaceae bacterium]
MQAEVRARNLRRLLKPRHVCIVGGQAMEDSIRRCADTGFAGEIWIVNPKREELGGRRCYAGIADLPEAPDATFIAVPREPTIDILKQLQARGAGGAICYAAGYAEVGGEGVGLQKQLIEAAGDLAMVGPNCYGILNYLDGIALWPTGHNGKRVETGCAFIGQSGNIALNVTANDRSVPFAYVISSGNQVVLSVADFVEALADDPKVTAIGLYIEAINDVAGFSRAAAKAMQAGKPLVALKAGKSELGAKLAMSHTSSLAGSDRMYDALFERLGIIRVETLPELMETMKFVSAAGLPKGNRLAVFTCSGGDGLMTADIAEAIGLPLPQHSPAQVAELRTQLPNFATISNPLDYNTSLWGHVDLLTRCFDTVMKGEYDGGMVVLDYATDGPASEQAWDAAVLAIIQACKQNGKLPMVTATLPELLPARVRDMMIAAGGAPMQGLPEALKAYAAAERFARQRDALTGKNALDRMILPALPKGSGASRMLSEHGAKSALKRQGLVVPESRVVAPAEAAAAAAALGFPVVLKVAEPVIAHKTEAGAVAVNLKSAAELEAALEKMKASVARHQPGTVIQQVLIEKMVSGVVAELIVGVKRDPQFGLALVVGAGGILVEMVQDSALLLLPTDRAAIERAVRGLKIAKVLQGYRGRPAGDVAAAVDAIAAVAAYAEAYRDDVLELDVNPLMVLEKGAVAVDALIVLAER